MVFPPAEDYRYALRLNDEGTDVAILQLNLPNLTVDGRFGATTDKAVRDWQRKKRLVIDGIAGLATQQSIITTLARPATAAAALPDGMLKSIAFNESSFQLANAGRHGGDDGWDAGAYARSSGSSRGPDSFYEAAFNAKASAEWTALNAQNTRRRLTDPVPSRYFEELALNDLERFRWQLTILAHNWPGNWDTGYGGAAGICNHGRASTNDDAPAEWISEATNGRLATPRQWVTSYVTKATVYVEW